MILDTSISETPSVYISVTLQDRNHFSGPLKSCSLVANGKDQESGEYKKKLLPLFTAPYPFVSILISLHMLHILDVEQRQFRTFEKYCKSLLTYTSRYRAVKGVGKAEAQLQYLWIK